ncbi:MAG TPA: TraR/DksA C4-type zinc finger protein [Candidatus Eisenbacteria bacterium]|nr:TraR/DksA C4-type zinc finger protein [Candidatus Eisenbacteria bacterium]
MNKKELKTVEKKLLEDRERLLKEINHLDRSFVDNLKESSGDLSAYSFHMADQGSDTFEREMNHLRMSTEGRLLMDTVEALRRLYRGEYGICQKCETKIGKERLIALPQARLCLDCQVLEERTPR